VYTLVVTPKSNLAVTRYYPLRLRRRHTYVIAPLPASGLALKLQRIPTVIS